MPDTPDRLGRYRLARRLAVGGMGEVFLARETGLAGFNRLVVVKRLLPELADRPELVTLFIDEARIAAHLAHPNVVHVHDFGVQDATYFLAMEYVPGQNLARILGRAGRDRAPLPRAMLVHIVAEMARGLEFVHSARDADGRPLGIVHRDISPQNLLVSYFGDVKLMDFGIAKAAIRRQHTEAGVLRGKLAYMSPEQAEGHVVDARSDVFSAGVVLWEVTVGQRLFKAESEMETLRLVRTMEIPRPRKLDPSYPAALEEIVMAALARPLEQRLASAGALESALRDFLATAGQRIERADIGVAVRRLFPEHCEMAEELRELSMSSRATNPLPDTAPFAGPNVPGIEPIDVLAGQAMSSAPSIEIVNASTRATKPERHRPDRRRQGDQNARVSTRSTVAGVVPAPTPPLGMARRRTFVAIGGLAIVSTAGLVIGLGVSSDTTHDRVVDSGARAHAHRASLDVAPLRASALAPSQDVPATVNAPLAPELPDAGVPAGTHTVATRGRGSDRQPSRARPKAPRTREPPESRPADDDKVVAAITASESPDPSPRPEPAVAGQLIVDSDPWGTVTVATRTARTPAIFRDLEPGTQVVSIVLSGSGIRYARRIEIASGMRTKCKATKDGLTCGAPAF